MKNSVQKTSPLHDKTLPVSNSRVSDLNSRCKALAKSGKRCRAAAMDGGLCFFHANPNKASELGRIGGRKNRHTPSEVPPPAANLDSVAAVRQTVAMLVKDVYAGRVHPRIATGLAPLLNLQLRVLETSDLEQRLQRLEKSFAELGLEDASCPQTSDPDTNAPTEPSESSADEQWFEVEGYDNEDTA